MAASQSAAHDPTNSRDTRSPSFRVLVPPGRPVIVVGGGKAAVGMASGLLRRLQEAAPGPGDISGLLSIPEGGADGFDIDHWPIEVCETRPRNENLPTDRSVAATRRMQQMLAQAPASAVAFCLVSGGASALLCDPPDGVSLQDLRDLVDSMSRAGMTIQQMNTVRQHLDNVKGGGLAARFPGDDLVTLVLSDVLGDRLEWIGSGPTVPASTVPADALAIVRQLEGRGVAVPHRISSTLQAQCPAPRFRSRGRARVGLPQPAGRDSGRRPGK